MIRHYQMSRRREGTAVATVNRETSALSRMFRLAFDSGGFQPSPASPLGCSRMGRDKGSSNTLTTSLIVSSASWSVEGAVAHCLSV